MNTKNVKSFSTWLSFNLKATSCPVRINAENGSVLCVRASDGSFTSLISMRLVNTGRLKPRWRTRNALAITPTEEPAPMALNPGNPQLVEDLLLGVVERCTECQGTGRTAAVLTKTQCSLCRGRGYVRLGASDIDGYQWLLPYYDADGVKTHEEE